MSKKVFFLGAGFSKALDPSYLLLKDLSERISGKLQKSSVDQHYNNEVITRAKENIESLLTYLGTDFPWKSDAQKHADLAVYVDVVRIISQEFEGLVGKVKSDSTEEMSHIIFQKLKVIPESCGYNFITLNYDLLLEDILSRVCCAPTAQSVPFRNFYKYPVSWIGNRAPDPNGTYILEGSYDPVESPVVLKLHGSANWYWSGIHASDPIYCKSIGEINPRPNIDAGLVPFIIPPVMDKNGFYTHVAIKFLWREAKKLLKEADEIYIIGFSFPQTDLSVRYLFQSALHNSAAKIYVVNSAPEQCLRVNYDLVFDPEKSQVSYDYCGDNDVVKRFFESDIINS